MVSNIISMKKFDDSHVHFEYNWNYSKLDKLKKGRLIDISTFYSLITHQKLKRIIIVLVDPHGSSKNNLNVS